MGSFNLTHSELADLSSIAGLERPMRDMHIEHNRFMNTGGLWAYQAAGGVHNLYIRNNLFYNTSSPIHNAGGSPGLTDIIVSHNSFVEIDGIILSLAQDFDTAIIKAVENYWGTTDPDVIDSMILDANDSIRIKNHIEYLPFLTEPHPNTPNLPLEIITAELLSGVVEEHYEEILEASGVAPPYAWAIVDGSLPPGLILAGESGVISGTPTLAGTFNFTVEVTDDEGLTATQVLSITITEPIEDWLVNLRLTTDPHIGIVPGEGYGFAFGARGGASEGFDAAEGDEIAPPDPVGDGINAYFYYPHNPEEHKRLVTSVVGPAATIIWPLRVKSVGDPADTQATLTWDAADIAHVPAWYATLALKDTDGNTLANMRTESDYTFNLTAGETRDFQIVASQQAEFIHHLTAGWNMISLPLSIRKRPVPPSSCPAHVAIYGWECRASSDLLGAWKNSFPAAATGSSTSTMPAWRY
jgi:hypothetical protein